MCTLINKNVPILCLPLIFHPVVRFITIIGPDEGLCPLPDDINYDKNVTDHTHQTLEERVNLVIRFIWIGSLKRFSYKHSNCKQQK